MANRSFGWTYRPQGEPVGQPTTFFRPVSIWEKHRLAGFDPPEFDQWGDPIPPEVVERQRKREARRKKQQADYLRGGPTPRGRSKGRGAKPSTSNKARVIERDGPWCRYCGRELDPEADDTSDRLLTLDHVMPRSLGGTNAVANLVVCCKRCNLWKGDRPLGKATQPDGRTKGGRVLMTLRPPQSPT